MERLKNIFYLILTFLFYKPFMVGSGKKIIFRNPILVTPRCLNLGSNIFIRDFARLEGVTNYRGIAFQPIVTIGDNVFIEQNLHLTCAGAITIGNRTAIAANVTITDIEHPHDDITIAPEEQRLIVKEVKIGENCKIYNNVVILPGTKLGTHNIVGANSVVSGSYPDYCVIAGSPARIVRKFDVKNKSWN